MGSESAGDQRRPRPGIGAVTLLGALLALAPAAQAAPFHAEAALDDIRQQLTFGSRAMGTPGHDAAIAMIRTVFGKLGAPVTLQTWTEQTPAGPRRMTNVIARFDPANPRRILLGTHYDSIARAYADAHNPQAVMPGANNSASGVALLLETARALRRAPAQVGVDFVFFDGEEGPISLGAGDPNWRALGSPHFVAQLRNFYPQSAPATAVIFDMVCYRAMKLQPEPSSLSSASRQVSAFWRIGRKLAPAVFDYAPTPYAIDDDHDAFQRAGVPAFLVIGFEYAPFFNTTEDTLDKCSPASLQAVGDTLLAFVHAQ